MSLRIIAVDAEESEEADGERFVIRCRRRDLGSGRLATLEQRGI
jgi:hypothetical protein